MIKAIITDFDGTLVDTFEANYQAYKLSFERYYSEIGIKLSREQYRQCFGLRFDAFMDVMGISDDSLRKKLREEKARIYPMCFKDLIPNTSLISFLRNLKSSGILLAIASTARKENLMNALNYLQLAEMFDLIIAGEQVKEGKPNPEIYLTSMQQLGVSPQDTLIFEDSEVGLLAAEASGANYIKITPDFFDHGTGSKRSFGL